MMNFKILVAGLYVTVSARYELTRDICRPYMTDRPWSDITIYATPREIEQKKRHMSIPLTDEQAECICLNDQLSLKLLPHDAFLLHAAVIQKGERCYAFCAPRGVGKSTHAAMWMEAYGKENICVINGDKPIIRRGKDGRFIAYGTPWCGKEGLNSLHGAELHCITFIERGMQDKVDLVTEREYLDRLIGQVVFPADRKTMSRGAALLADFMRATPAALATCTMTKNAAMTVHDFWKTMK
ncbi:MAG: hypothetical protein IJW40_04720 [Clostridia bacterium]|nr:hypothetical protein [Clostridia bacterium]